MSGIPGASYDGTLERTDEGGVIRFERHLPYAIDEVWDAITNPARLAQWWLPFEAEISIDLRAGGQMVITGVGEEPATITCTILRVDEPVLLEHTHLDATSYLRWELEPVDTGCVLRLSHFLTDTGRAIEKSYVAGLHTSLGRLVPCLAGRPLPWDWDAFAEAQTYYATAGVVPPDSDT